MLLIERGRRPRAICRECRALHGQKACPKRRSPAELDRKAAERHADRVWRYLMSLPDHGKSA